MKFTYQKAFFWFSVFVVLSLVPLVFAVLGPIPRPRTFWIEFGVGLGFVGMGVMALQFISTGRLRWIAPSFGSDFVLQFHRQAGVIGVLLVLAHPITLILSNPVYLEYFDPRVNFLRALALSVVTVALILLIITSIWREEVGLRYEWWRVSHGVLSLAVVFIGMVHGIQVGHYLGPFWKQGLWAGVLLGAIYLVVHTRVVRPWLMRRRPYRIVEINEEKGDSYTMTLEPVGHDGMKFRGGQFAWITVGDSPYSLQQHPFSFSSSDRQKQICFTAKALGDFTSTWEDMKPGACAYLEGPFGAFTLEPYTKGAFFIIGGIGITPVMSILRSMYDNRDLRPAILLYGNNDEHEITFDEELEELSHFLDLKIVHVIQEPGESWEGHNGYIDEDLIKRYLPENKHEYEYFICGPKPLMDSAESALRAQGISWLRIFSERFQIV
ncbi:MAG: ferric reductase-like transmembrane domain-containing protein [Caldilineaceae bacterium]|nr:ferric reductase-like transmembrane domain-containing protein [Caldilineaceae bacterium]